ncbi:MAG: response regulator, partial [Leptospirales bacterium]
QMTVDLIRHNLQHENADEPDGLTIRMHALRRLSAGMSYMQSDPVDALILDLGLPDSDGLETFIQVATRRFDVPVIVHTAIRDVETEKRCLSLGAQDYLTKGSVTGSELRRRVRAAVLRHRFARSLRDVVHRVPPEASIALIDEDPGRHAAIEEYTRRSGVPMHEIREPDAALELIRTWAPGVILVHRSIDGFDALQVIRNLRSAPDLADIPIILLTSEYDEAALQQATECGVEEFLMVPVQPRELHARLTTLLTIRNQSARIGRLRQELTFCQQLIASYFGQKHIEQIKSQFLAGQSPAGPDEESLPVHRADMTLLRVDLSPGFAAFLAEDSGEAAAILGSVLNDMMELAISAGGSIAEISGEGMLAAFGYPDGDPAGPTQATHCAVKLAQYFDMFVDADLTPFQSGGPFRFTIGIATSQLLATVAGSFRRRELSFMGDAVTATRELLAHIRGAIKTDPREAPACLVDQRTYDAARAATEFAQGFHTTAVGSAFAPMRILS